MISILNLVKHLWRMEVEGVVSQHTRERIGAGYILESLKVEKNMKGGHSS